jgi:hypothetical protein
MAKYLLLLCLLGMMSIQLAAQADTTPASDSTKHMMIDRIRADRPGVTSTAYLVPKGYFQMEHGFRIEDTDPGFVYSYPSSLWKYGVNDNFEIRLRTEFITIQDEPNPDVNGFLPIALGFKSKLTEQHGIFPKISFIGEMTFPGLVDADFETTYFAPTLILTFNHSVSNFFSIAYDGGAVWNGETGEPNFIYSLEPSINITDRLSLFGELYGSTPQREEADLDLRVDAGISYLVGDNLLLDLSAGQGLSEEAVESFVELGVSYRFKL